MKLATWNQFCPTFFGTGASELIGEKAKGFGMSKILLVTENHLIKFGIVAKVQKKLEEAGLKIVMFDKVEIDAPSDVCDAGAAMAKKEKVDGIVAIGGGSSIDTAKAIAMLTGNPGEHISDYYKPGSKEIKRGVPLITIPTTAGTGSENTQYAVIADSATHVKEVPEYGPDLALIDPILTYTLPKDQTAATGMDALAHCCEAITSKFWNPYANVFAKEGIRLIFKWLPVAVREPNNAEAREVMSFAANLGGMAIMTCSCHLGHAWAQCFGGKFHIAHGLCCAWGLPAAMWFAGKWYSEGAYIVADAMEIKYNDKTTPDELAKMMAKKIVDLMREIGVPTIKSRGYTLEDCLSSADLFFNDAAFAGSPKENTTMEDVKHYITMTYEAYQ
jgi:1,3-propanediol dehydrogenase